jgi:hypothetical protein
MKPFQPVEVRGFSDGDDAACRAPVESRRALRVVVPRDGIVNGARADDDEEARVPSVEDALQRRATGGDGLGRDVGERNAGVDLVGRRHEIEARDVQVFERGERHLRRRDAPLAARSEGHESFDGGPLTEFLGDRVDAFTIGGRPVSSSMVDSRGCPPGPRERTLRVTSSSTPFSDTSAIRRNYESIIDREEFGSSCAGCGG